MESPYDHNGKVWKALNIRDCLELPTSPVARRNKDNFTQFQKSQSCQHLDRGLVASRTWGKSLLFLSCTRWPIPYYLNTCAALCKGVHLVSAYMMQMRGPVLYCSLSLRFCGKLINMIQKRQHTNAEALTLNPHPLLFSVIAPNYLIGSLWLCSDTAKNTVYCKVSRNHNAISNSIPIQSARCWKPALWLQINADLHWAKWWS